MNKFKITMLDNTNGEIFVEYMEIYGWPAFCDPYCGTSGRTGFIIRVEKSLTPTQENIYR